MNITWKIDFPSSEALAIKLVYPSKHFCPYINTYICICLYIYLQMSIHVLSITNWHFPTTSARIESCTAAAVDLQHPGKGVQGGEQK